MNPDRETPEEANLNEANLGCHGMQHVPAKRRKTRHKERKGGEKEKRGREREGRSWEANLWGQAKQAARAPTCTCNQNPITAAHARRSASRKQSETMPGKGADQEQALAHPTAPPPTASRTLGHQRPLLAEKTHRQERARAATAASDILQMRCPETGEVPWEDTLGGIQDPPVPRGDLKVEPEHAPNYFLS